MRNRALRTIVAVSALLAASPVSAQVFTRDIAFPVEGAVTFSDDFSDARSGGRQHEGNDLMGKKMQPLLAAVDGFVRYVVDPEATWGCGITIEDAEDWSYHYLHVNNDTPGTDDGVGCAQYAYAPGIDRGARVTRGQLVGWMGDSGNAENVGPHLHFEMRMPGGTAVNPYESLRLAQNVNRFIPAEATAAALDIGADRGLVANSLANCIAGSRVKTAGSTAVYYCGADGKRYAFPNAQTYASWYPDFSGVETISPEALASLPLGGSVTYRPGVRMLKIQTDPKVYAVDRGGTLRWVQTPEIAAAMYGSNWAKMIDDVSDAFFTNYKVGLPVSQP